ncbi:hypothetical protein B6U96_10205 [Archaeoglobales archaeon ex4484_92]|nr:MAG: hypothetical protein B6U96_10205 [Archaeoglobales archaeon ex4484_92]
MNLRSAKFVSVDLETTGLNPKRDEIIAIAIVPLDGTKILASKSFYSLIKPSKFKIETIKIHGIDPKSLHSAPSFGDIANEVRLMLNNKILIGHSVNTDYKFLRVVFKKHNYEFRADTIDIILLEQVLAERLGEKLTWEDQSLENIAKRYGIRCLYRHNALADAFIAAQIFQIQILKLIKYGITTVERLKEVLSDKLNSRIKFNFINF